MKKLMKMKLINWHRFLNETIEINNSVLLSGENGAGKSTILDAIQFVLTCSKNNFNKAANENGKRTLAGYVRCKLGKENRPYEREGQITAHIALEFYEEEKNKSFIVGAVIDSASESKEKAIWYRLENKSIEDDLFLQGNKPKNIEIFKITNKSAQILGSHTEAKRDFKNRFGRLEDKFFELIPKALAFKPIDDIKDFVYSYVLDKKEVNIEALKDNVRSYQELEKMLQIIKKKIDKLEAIRENYEKIVSLKQREKFYEYFIKRSELEITTEAVNNIEKHIEKLNREIEEIEMQRNQLQKEVNDKKATYEKLEYELSHNEEYLAIKDLENKIERLKPEIEALERRKAGLLKNTKTAIKNAKAIIDIDDNFEKAKLYLESLNTIEKDFELLKVKDSIEGFIIAKKTKNDEITKKLVKYETETEAKETELLKVEKRISELEKKKLQYKPEVVMLQTEIKRAFNNIGREVEPRILCELLRITDEKWKNAVEGYLNTQRFYLLVEPEDFDLAVNVYENIRKNKGLHSVGLINTGKLEKYDKCEENTLAAVVTSQSIWAKRFANMILGKVILCEKLEQLKNHKCAITPKCMLYQNHVARAIDPKVYGTPFIGEDAYKIQLQQAIEEKKIIKSELDEIIEKLNYVKKYKELLITDYETEIKFNLDILPSLKVNTEQLNSLKEQKLELEKNNNYIQKQLTIENIKKEINKLEGRKENLIKQKGCNENEIDNQNKTKKYKLSMAEVQKQELTDIKNKLSEQLLKAEKEYEVILLEKLPDKINEDYENTKKRTETTRGKLEEDLKDKQYKYKSEHDFGAEATFEGAKFFIEELTKLKDSEVLSYEEKVYSAKKSAEIEFKEQFLSKLQENIKKAQGEFKHLNKALRDIKFGSEAYEFKYSESKRFGKYYKMIMDDFNIVEGYSLLSGQFNDRHKEVIEELFEKLTLDEENSTKTLEEFTDYRTYMDYDIHIDHGDGTVSYYSKVCKEKSGGETQTPFYVTIAASFIQLYSQGINGEAIGLILFDEAFDKMDDERSAGVLEFLKKLKSLQLIMAAPPEKIQYIAPFVESTLLVLKQDNVSYVEVYSHEEV